jgi:hypothetical protein
VLSRPVPRTSLVSNCALKAALKKKHAMRLKHLDFAIVPDHASDM